MKFNANGLTLLASHFLLYTSSSAGVLGAPTEEDVQQKYIKMNANVLRGNTYDDAVQGSKAAFIEKRDTDGSVTMKLTNGASFYQVVLEIGSEKTSVDILVDTGSSDLWVMNSNNTYCSSSSNNKARDLSDITDFTHLSRGRDLIDLVDFTEHDPETRENDLDRRDSFSEFYSELGGLQTEGIFATNSVESPQATVDCSTYGTFDPTDSTSFVSNGTSFAITYGDKTFANGTWGYDDVTFNGVTVKDLSFAVADESDSTIGVLGIGLPGLETTYSGLSAGGNYYQYENLPLKMVSQGLINTPAYSVYLNDTDASVASILFGAVDHDKYTGDLTLMPIVNVMSSYGYSNPITLSVTLSSLSVNDASSEATIGQGAAAALLDTGTTLTYFPSDVLSELVDVLQLSYSDSLSSYYMTCSNADNYNVTFNFLGTDIVAPLSSFLVSVTSSSGFSSDSTSDYCALGIYSSGDNTFTLGDSFLRNVYLVADLENYVVGLGQANFDSKSEDIDIISDSIPSAVSAASYSSTWGSDNTVLNVASTSMKLTSGSGTTATRGGSTKSSSASESGSDSSVSSAKSTSSSSSSGSSSSSKSGSSMTYQLSLPLLGVATLISLSIFV